ncbi:Fanconi anemia group I protein [Coccinella septempunctata]|uniref:Fanconi anemia group I protein n=1 Tax=Coccinella septempunctata TaxID=41139 RepID=UPI001D099E13|nr:Fanconi anemia group I protein [Coccinella septempunctata]
MDIIQIVDAIDKYAENGKYRELGEFLCNNFEVKQIVTFIQDKVLTLEFVKIWKNMLLALSHFQEKCITIITATLKFVDENEIPTARVNDLLHYIINALPKFETQYLVALLKFCLKGFQNMNSCTLCWKDIFPEIVSKLSEKESIEFEGKCLSGKEVEKEVVNILCSLQWEPSRVVIVISILCEIPLNKEDHIKVLNKLGSYMESLMPQEVPSFTYQLLRFCKTQCFLSVVIMLQQYFGLRLYKAIIGSVDLSIDEDEQNNEIKQYEEAELSVFYHIRTLASHNSFAIKDYLVFLKTINKAPEFILHPFHIKVLLVIFEVEDYRDKVWDILKSLILRYFNEKSKRESSIWFSRMSSKLMDIETIINTLINSSTSFDISESLLNFGLMLLNVKSALPHIVDSNVLRLWNLGKTIVQNILQKFSKHNTAILDRILTNMRANKNIDSHLECLSACKKTVLMAMVTQQKFMYDIMEDLQQIPGNSAILLLDIVLPLTKLNSNVKDQTILLFRKSLYSSKTETRQMAVVGYTKLLMKIPIKNVESLSQMSSSLSSSSSGPSLFTQLSLNRSQSQGHFSNEALSWEILSILKRCFMQKLEVRNQLYEGLFQAAYENKDLSVPILEILWTQISKYYIIEEETLPPLDFSKLSIVKDINVIQQETFGKLLYVIGLILVQIQSEDFPSTVEKFQMVLDSICERMISCELIHFELDDGTDLSDPLPECKEKVIILQEAMRVCEALIAYKIKSWNNKSENNGTQIISLFKTHSRLLHFAKNIGKAKKQRKKKDDNVQKSALAFRLPETVLDVNILVKALQLLHEPVVEWTSMVEANVVRSSREIHRHFFQSIKQIFSSAKNKKSKNNFACPRIKPEEAYEIACIIYNRCIKNLDNYKDFDSISAIEAAECFQIILGFVSPYEVNKETFDPLKDEESQLYLWNIIKTYQKLFEDHEELENEDPEMKKLPPVLLNTLTLLFSLMPSEISGSSKEFYNWMVQYAKDQTLSSKPSATLFFSLLFNMHLKYELDSKLFKCIISSIGNVLGMTREEEGEAEEECFKIVNEISVNSAFTTINNALKSLLDDVEIILTKLKCEHSFRTHVPVYDSTKFKKLTATAALCRRQSLSEKEASVSELLYVIAKLLDGLTAAIIPPGLMAELLLRNIIQIYSILVNFAKYFSTLSTTASAAMRGARFEELVKFIGRQLSPDINFFILHLEEEDKKNQLAQTKKKSHGVTSRKEEILKNTRCIPKLVYVMEQFSKCIMHLSNKTKFDLHKYIGQGTTRDFRILVNELDIPEKDESDSQENNENEELDGGQEDNEDLDTPVSHEDNDDRIEEKLDDLDEEEQQDSDNEDILESSTEDNEEDNRRMPPPKKLKR